MVSAIWKQVDSPKQNKFDKSQLSISLNAHLPEDQMPNELFTIFTILTQFIKSCFKEYYF